MSNLILPPKHKSVLTPDKQYEAYGRTAEVMRDTLFVGAIMGMAETAHESGRFSPSHQALKDLFRIIDCRSAAEVLLAILDLCYHEKWNVAVEMLNWKKTYIADKIKEKIHGEQIDGIQTSSTQEEGSGTDSSGGKGTQLDGGST